MKKILLCVFVLLVSVNVFASDVDIKRLTEAANKGDSEAQFQLGESYYAGLGVTLDYKQAVYWYTKAARQGLAEAQHALGSCYAQANGVIQNYIEAVKWFTLSAEQNFAYAQISLGYCYEDGYGVPQSYKLAYMWYSLSLPNLTDTGDKDSLQEMIEELELNMTAAEIAEAQAMAAEWMAKHK